MNDPRQLIAQLAAAVITADERVTTAEIDALRHLDDLGLGRLSPLTEAAMERAVHQPIDVASAAQALRALGGGAAPIILAALADIAAADRILSPAEMDMLSLVASSLGLSDGEAEHVLTSVLGAQNRPSEPAAAHPPPPMLAVPGDDRLAHARRVLDAEPAATRAEIEASYRRLIERYNPAKVIDLGPDFAALAVRKLAQATEAYQAAIDALEPSSQE
jgi:DnaJ-domain-containing protein 1